VRHSAGVAVIQLCVVRKGGWGGDRVGESGVVER